MSKLYHYPLDPFCRRIRISVAEFGKELELVEERPWEARTEFLQMNPTGLVPVLVADDGIIAAGIEAAEGYLEDTRDENTPSQLGTSPAERAETRRLVAWFDGKFHHDVSAPLLIEKVVRRFIPPDAGGGAPNMNRVRGALDKIRPQLEYIASLTQDRNWLAGDEISLADFAAASHLSVLDYLGDVPWSANDEAKAWYQRIKSRPSFRSLLTDKVQGMPPPRIYADLDF
ncbi:Glutathione S-transferase family protein [hydrothermal vent metagenome]|uniref:Glutathione S-transferase family protein n=1 Tax=hydrothermal vent metagenome TaxID=652676 RepID=A0A3B0SN31_9ZZZZ